jgi:hypothetical protein
MSTKCGKSCSTSLAICRVLLTIRAFLTRTIISTLMWIKAKRTGPIYCSQALSSTLEEWRPISTELPPFWADLELVVIDHEGPHALIFPCRRISGGFMRIDTKGRIDVRLTHWAIGGPNAPLVTRRVSGSPMPMVLPVQRANVRAICVLLRRCGAEDIPNPAG